MKAPDLGVWGIVSYHLSYEEKKPIKNSMVRLTDTYSAGGVFGFLDPVIFKSLLSFQDIFLDYISFFKNLFAQ